MQFKFKIFLKNLHFLKIIQFLNLRHFFSIDTMSFQMKCAFEKFRGQSNMLNQNCSFPHPVPVCNGNRIESKAWIHMKLWKYVNRSEIKKANRELNLMNHQTNVASDTGEYVKFNSQLWDTITHRLDLTCNITCRKSITNRWLDRK